MHSNELNDLKTVGDVLNYFLTEVKDTTVIEDFSKIDLPKNLHINTEYIQWDPEDSDDLFDEKSAFPNVKTQVTSIKYRRKYGQTEGDIDWSTDYNTTFVLYLQLKYCVDLC